jgi:hypothetical protein
LKHAHRALTRSTDHHSFNRFLWTAFVCRNLFLFLKKDVN